jgi:hypothetical protein
MHDAALLLCGGQFLSQGRRQPAAPITNDHAHASGVQAARPEGHEEGRPRRSILGGSRLIVKQLPPAIRPHAHHGQDHAFLAAHLLPFMATPVDRCFPYPSWIIQPSSTIH